MKLLLLTRQGCCLCEGLAERLAGLDPAPQVQLVEVDADPALQRRYGLEVPVLMLPMPNGQPQELPRVPPRLAGAQLAEWLQRQISKL
ncbi:MAG: hypothetical protein RLZZ158_2363 [Cyanobacteriota bacterium]|jgi:hypothetical protein